MSTLAFLVVVAAMGIAVAWATAVLVYPVWSHLAERSPRVARGAVAAAALPWLVGAAFVAAGFLPGDPHTGQILGCHCAASGPDWAHLCPAHPASALGLLPFAAMTLALLLPGRVRMWRGLAREPLGSGAGATPTILDLPRPTALLVGWLRPSLVVDRRLWSNLSRTDRAVVLAHERVHLGRRDPAVLMLLRVLCAVGPRSAADRLARAWLRRAELSADAGAARAVGDPLVVADTLLRCARMGGQRRAALAVSWTSGSLEGRVQALLGGRGAARGSDQPDLGRRDAALFVASAIGVVSATPWVHHQIEHLLNLSF